VLDIRPGLEQIFNSFHRDSIQRKIRRAEREGLSYEKGRTSEVVEEFYRLLVMTRRRHRRLPQPRAWFRNLLQCLGGQIEIRVARKNGRPIAAMLTLRNRSSVVYKYGCSDERSHNLGGMPFLFWKLIEESKGSGAEVIDLGRSDWDQAGLMTFKDRLGAERSSLKYYRYSRVKSGQRVSHRNPPGVRYLFPVLPEAVLCAAGEMLYKHMG
jgi:lipid II:glycine glycyltransferase (peptidoglycan interpeptide bridge formation enzyme)